MISTILYALLFISSAILQVSLVHSFDFPLAIIPLHFLIGVVVLQRAGLTIGWLWFLASAPFLNSIGFSGGVWWAYLFSIIVGTLLAIKVFTSNSVYGLIGLALCMYTIFFILNTFTSETQSVLEFFYELIFGSISLVAGIYFAFLSANMLEKIGNNILITKKPRNWYE